ncbi:MAG: OFA family MFS transporter [Thermoplasmata archaeon]|nr:OFA family MFS transporter [Thermoplasmata archaeon]MCJ7562647.1 OFA family MFS transporter [Thermoplasmata archaeon]TFG70965.1 MAG: MFS transporter [Methanomassiliicoccus sp.]
MEASEKNTMNRWLPVVGALLIQLALGAVYAFSIFTGPLSETLGHARTSFYILGIFGTAIAVFAITMIVAGRLQDKRGPRVVATLGGLVYGAGYIVASFFTENIAMLYVSYGIIGGIGLGLGYVCPLAAVVKWFPDKKGLVSGIAVAGFGAGAFIFTQVGKYIINASDDGLSNAFLYLGLIFIAMVVAGAQLLRNPPVGWMPKGFNPDSKHNGQVVDYDWHEMVKSRSFILLNMMFLLSATAGLMMIGNVSNVAAYLDPSKTMLVVAQAPTIAGVLALFNGAGRIGWGKVSDILGRNKTMRLVFLIQALILFGAAAFVWAKPADEMLQFIGLTAFASAIGFTFGGNFALFPSATADYFGTKNLGVNYGLVFTGYGAAGVLGSLIPSLLAGSDDGFTWVFVAVGIASLVTFAMAMVIRPPQKK